VAGNKTSHQLAKQAFHSDFVDLNHQLMTVQSDARLWETKNIGTSEAMEVSGIQDGDVAAWAVELRQTANEEYAGRCGDNVRQIGV